KGFLETPEVAGQFKSQFWTSPYDMPTIFENLAERGLTWTVYFDDYAQAFALRRLHPDVERFKRYEQFAQDITQGALPTYAFIEPRSFSAPGHVDHTVYDHTSVPATIKKMFGLPRFLTARDAAANTVDRNFLAQARTVSLANLKTLVPTARAAPAGGGPLSAYQRSLKALAEAIGALPGSAPGADEAARYAQAFLQQPQSP